MWYKILAWQVWSLTWMNQNRWARNQFLSSKQMLDGDTKDLGLYCSATIYSSWESWKEHRIQVDINKMIESNQAFLETHTHKCTQTHIHTNQNKQITTSERGYNFYFNFCTWEVAVSWFWVYGMTNVVCLSK
jgi:hypothetical protein